MQLQQSYIYIKGIRLHAYHGVLPQERLTGNEYLIDLMVEYPVETAMLSDRVEDTMSYADAFELVKAEMKEPSALIEHVARRIGEVVFLRFPKAASLVLRITKQNPPMGASCDGAGVELHLINDKTV